MRVRLLSIVVFAGLALAWVAGPSPAGADPILLDAGWTYDEIGSEFTDSVSSPHVYALPAPAIFRITDQFLAGDTFFVYDFGSLILTTSLNGAQASVTPIGDPAGDAGWTDASFQHGEVLLSAGDHIVTIQGDGALGVPAGFYARIDSTAPVPEPSSLALLGVGLAAYRLRRRRQAR